MTATLPPRPRGDDPSPPRVDIYARLSRNPDGELEKIETQVADCRKVAERNGWTVAEVHKDPSLSAWKRGVRRPGWENLLDRMKNRKADGVIVWHTDRLLRQPRDLEQLIDFGERDGLVVASAYGEYDLSRSDDRFMLRVQAASAAKSSDDTSRRIRRRFQTKREAGMSTGGARAFGFPGDDRARWPRNEKGQPVPPRDERGERVRTPVSIEQVEREREAIRAGCQEVMDRGEDVSLTGLAARWNADELWSATGARWTPVTVREVLLRARNAGLVEHDGVVVGRTGDAIISEDMHAEVRAVFAARRRGRPASGRYLASAMVHCAECGHTLGGRPAGTYRDGSPRRQYACAKQAGGCGRVAVDGAGLDAWLRTFTLERLSDPKHTARLSARLAEAVERQREIAAELDRARSTAEGLGDRLGRGEIELDTFDAAIRPLRARIARLETERDELRSDRPDDVPDDSDLDTLTEQWDSGSVEDRRTMLSNALRGWRVEVDPATARGRFDHRRVRANPLGTPDRAPVE